MSEDSQIKCELCGEPMPPGEEMFKFHGHSGPCPNTPLQPHDRMLKWFEFGHLPANLQLVSRPFCELAATIVVSVDPGPERTVSLRKLLEAKDAAVRAKINPGG